MLVFWLLGITAYIVFYITGGVWTAGYIRNLCESRYANMDETSFNSNAGGIFWVIILPIILINHKLKIVHSWGHRRSERYVAMEERRIENEDKIREMEKKMRVEQAQAEKDLDIEISGTKL